MSLRVVTLVSHVDWIRNCGCSRGMLINQVLKCVQIQHKRPISTFSRIKNYKVTSHVSSDRSCSTAHWHLSHIAVDRPPGRLNIMYCPTASQCQYFRTIAHPYLPWIASFAFLARDKRSAYAVADACAAFQNIAGHQTAFLHSICVLCTRGAHSAKKRMHCFITKTLFDAIMQARSG